jgi:hypothetical protein
LIGTPGATVDADDTEVTTDRMTEEELLKGLEGLAPFRANKCESILVLTATYWRNDVTTARLGESCLRAAVMFMTARG